MRWAVIVGALAIVEADFVAAQENYVAQPPSGVYQQLPTGFAPYRPVTPDPFGPYDLLGGYARAGWTARQPSGHEIIYTSHNGYVYRPTFVEAPTLGDAGGPYAPVNPAPQPAAATTADRSARQIYVAPPAPTASETLDRAIAQFRRGQYAQASDTLDWLLAREPQNGLAHLLNMHARFAQGDYAGAAEALRAALGSLPPERWTAVLDNYRAYYVATPYARHLSLLEQYVADHSNDPNARLLLGYQACALGQRDEGLKHLQLLATQQPLDPTVVRLIEHWNPGRLPTSTPGQPDSPFPPERVAPPAFKGPAVF